MVSFDESDFLSEIIAQIIVETIGQKISEFLCAFFSSRIVTQFFANSLGNIANVTRAERPPTKSKPSVDRRLKMYTRVHYSVQPARVTSWLTYISACAKAGAVDRCLTVLHWTELNQSRPVDNHMLHDRWTERSSLRKSVRLSPIIYVAQNVNDYPSDYPSENLFRVSGLLVNDNLLLRGYTTCGYTIASG